MQNSGDISIETKNRYSEHNNLPPVLPKEDEPVVRSEMAHSKDYGPLIMIK